MKLSSEIQQIIVQNYSKLLSEIHQIIVRNTANYRQKYSKLLSEIHQIIVRNTGTRSGDLVVGIDGDGEVAHGLSEPRSS
jgi:hypothetical protein